MTTTPATRIATIDGIRGGAQLYVEIDRDAAGPAAFIDTNGEVQLDAAELRCLAAACLDAADQLDALRSV